MIQAFFHPDIFDQIVQINSLKDRSALENGKVQSMLFREHMPPPRRM
jgi:hypothetical protein